MFNVITTTSAYQRQHLRTRVGHVGCGVEPVLEEKEQAEDEPSSLPLGKEVRCQSERHRPLQDRSTPDAECRAKPAEQQVTAFVDYQICEIDE